MYSMYGYTSPEQVRSPKFPTGVPVGSITTFDFIAGNGAVPGYLHPTLSDEQRAYSSTLQHGAPLIDQMIVQQAKNQGITDSQLQPPKPEPVVGYGVMPQIIPTFRGVVVADFAPPDDSLRISIGSSVRFSYGLQHCADEVLHEKSTAEIVIAGPDSSHERSLTITGKIGNLSIHSFSDRPVTPEFEDGLRGILFTSGGERTEGTGIERVDTLNGGVHDKDSGSERAASLFFLRLVANTYFEGPPIPSTSMDLASPDLEKRLRDRH